MNKVEMNAQSTKEMLFEMKEITCTKTEYHRDVRDGILDFQMRSKDLGKTDLVEHCQKQLEKLDQTHGLPPQ